MVKLLDLTAKSVTTSPINRETMALQATQANLTQVDDKADALVVSATVADTTLSGPVGDAVTPTLGPVDPTVDPTGPGGGTLTPIDGTDLSGAIDIDGTIRVLAEAPTVASGSTEIFHMKGATSEYTISLKSDGTIVTSITVNGTTTISETSAGFVSAGDQFVVHLAWGKRGVDLDFENRENGVHQALELPTTIVGNDLISDANAPTNVSEYGEDVLRVQVFDEYVNFVRGQKDGVYDANNAVDGSDFGDIIYTDYADAQGDRVTDGDDLVYGNGGDDLIYAYGGDDKIFGGTGDDSVFGGAGDDVIDVSGGSRKVEAPDDLTQGTVISADGAGVLTSFTSNTDVPATTAPVGSESDVVQGGTGSDTIIADAGDVVDGGSIEGEHNTLQVADGVHASHVDMNPNGTSGTVHYMNGSTLVFQNIHAITGLPDSVLLVDGVVQGSRQDDIIDGNYEDDPHGDRVDNGDARLAGDTNDMDVIHAFDGNDTIRAGAEDDEVYAGVGDDHAEGNGGDDLIYGEEGDDTLYGDDLTSATVSNNISGMAAATLDSVQVTASDPCAGGDDVIFGGAGNDEIFGQGGDDQLTGDGGDDDIYGGCGNDIITGDNETIGEDLDPSDGCVTIIDDSPCFCIDVETTKAIVTEDVWFAQEMIVPTGIDGMIIGDCDLVEGHDGTFKIQLDQVVTVDTQVVINVTNGTAMQTTGTFEEFTSGVYFQYNTPAVSTYDTQWWFANSTHANSINNSGFYNNSGWTPPPGGSNPPGTTTFDQLYSDPTANNDSTGLGSHSDAYVGAANLVNDFTIKDAVGNIVNGNQIIVTVPAGTSMSEEFTVVANVEAMVRGVPGSYHTNYSEGDESFSLAIESVGGSLSSSGSKTVNIEDVHINVFSPIAFDLNCNGSIDVTGDSTAYGHAFAPGSTTVQFDLDANGTLDTIEWMAGTGDGLLVDLSQISFSQIGTVGALDGSALFGDQGGLYADGYEKLDLLDTDGDNLLTDAELNNLAIWVDDGDGILQSNEIEALADYGIDELVTVATPTVVNGETLLRSETVLDAEAMGTVQYSLSGDDAQFFQIDPDTGKITYADGVHLQAENPLDDDGNNQYVVNIIRTGGPFDQPNIEELVIKVAEDAEGGNDNLFGGLGNDIIDGDGGDDYIEGNEGNDVIDGSFGDDLIYGDTPSGGSGGGTGGSPFNGVEICIDYANVLPGSETAPTPNTATIGDSVIYTNVAVVGGVNVSMKLTLVDVSDPALTVDLASAQTGEILLNGVNNPAMHDKDATFEFGFFDPATGNPVVLNPVVVFSDLDKDAGNELLYVYDNVANAGVTSTTQIEHVFDAAGETVKAGGLVNNAPNTAFGDPDSALAVQFTQGSAYKFEFHSTANESSLNFGKLSDGDFGIEAGGTGGADEIAGGWGNDVIYGGVGDDKIDSSGDDCGTDGLPDIAVVGCNDADPDPFNDMDVVFGGAGNDTISTGDDNDVISGGTGNDIINAGVDRDKVTGDEGNDVIIGGEGSDGLYGGTGDDVIMGDDGIDGGCHTIIDCEGDPVVNNDADYIEGGAGRDKLYGGDDSDEIYGGDDYDAIYGGIDDDKLFGGAAGDAVFGGQGNDVINGGADADKLYGGADNDYFTGLTAGDYVDGGTEAHCGNDTTHDCDTLDLSDVGLYEIVNETNDLDGNSTSGTVNLLDTFGNVTGNIYFEEIEKIIPCFTPGTMIATPRGEVAVEDLNVGDKVLTRDNGMQEILWYGSKAIDQQDLLNDPKLRPVMITAGSLGHGLPEKDLMVSPNHRVLISNTNTALLFDDEEVLVAAKHLVDKPGIHTVDVARTDYIHFMFEQHEVVLSNGTWTESFQPGELSLNGIDDDQRDELYKLFPELQNDAGRQEYKSARHTLKAYEAKLAI